MSAAALSLPLARSAPPPERGAFRSEGGTGTQNVEMPLQHGPDGLYGPFTAHAVVQCFERVALGAACRAPDPAKAMRRLPRRFPDGQNAWPHLVGYRPDLGFEMGQLFGSTAWTQWSTISFLINFLSASLSNWLSTPILGLLGVYRE